MRNLKLRGVWLTGQGQEDSLGDASPLYGKGSLKRLPDTVDNTERLWSAIEFGGLICERYAEN